MKVDFDSFSKFIKFIQIVSSGLGFLNQIFYNSSCFSLKKKLSSKISLSTKYYELGFWFFFQPIDV